MAAWKDIELEVPALAAEVRGCFQRRKHATLATIRRNGAPRISGSEVEWTEGEVFLGSMPGAMKALDLRRDPRFALHSPTIDPPDDNPTAWEGEAKLAGTVEEVTDPTSTGAPHRFRLNIEEVVFTRVAGNQLRIQAWHEGRGLREFVRD